MKKITLFLVSVLVAITACKRKPAEELAPGYLSISVVGGLKVETTSEYILKVTNDQGVSFYDDTIAELTGDLALEVGTYTVEVYSSTFEEPDFEKPVYGGSQVVEIVSGETSSATLVCSQINAGVWIVWSNEFNKYQTYSATVTAENGEYLNYSATETRVGYFPPGTVSLQVSADGNTLASGDIKLAAGDMLKLTLSPDVKATGSLSVTVTVDETVNQRDSTLVLEPVPEPSTNSKTNPFSVAQAIANVGDADVGDADVWVIGYIVGAKPTGSSWILDPTIGSNIVIADSPSETEPSKLMAVEFSSAPTAIKNALNLPDNPGLLGHQVLLKGDLLKYFSQPGIKNLSEYELNP